MHHPRDVKTHTTHSLCYSSCGAMAGTRNSSIGPPWRVDPTTHCTMSEHSYYRTTSRSCFLFSSCYWHNNVHHFQAIIMHYYFNTRSEVDPGQGCIHSTYHLYVSHSNHWTTELVIQVQSSMQLLMRDYPIQNHHSLNTDAHFLSSPPPPPRPPSVGLSHNTSEVSVTWCSYFLTADSDSHCCGKTIYWLQNHSKISEKTTSSFLPLQVAIMLF